MYKPGDIVAVYGDTLSSFSIKLNHPVIDESNLIDRFSKSIEPVMGTVVKAVVFPSKEIGLIVSGKFRKDTAASEIFVNARQCKLIIRDGKPFTQKAEYISYCGYHGEFEAYSDIASLKADLSEKLSRYRDDEDEEGTLCDLDANVYKAIEITSEIASEIN